MMKIYHQEHLRKARIYNSKNPYFITLCMPDAQNILEISFAPEALIESIKWLVSNFVIYNLGFVIMTDHLHWAFALRGEYTLDNVIRRYKNYTTKQLKELMPSKAKIWQDGYYDHLIRDIRDFEVKLNYMHENPVRKGIVEKAEDYLYSTANEKYKDMIDWGYMGY